MIVDKETKVEKRIEIDLTSPEGNVYYLMGEAIRLARKLGLDYKVIQAEMTSSDYENAIQVLEKYFGNYVILYR